MTVYTRTADPFGASVASAKGNTITIETDHGFEYGERAVLTDERGNNYPGTFQGTSLGSRGQRLAMFKLDKGYLIAA
jgi:hypothetical protein